MGQEKWDHVFPQLAPVSADKAQSADSPSIAQLFGSPLYVQGTGDVNDISNNDIDQGDLGDCYFLASLGAVARTRPDIIKSAITDNGDGTYTVRLYKRVEGSGGDKANQFEPVYYRVTQEDLAKTSTNSFFQGDSDEMGRAELWPKIMEAAFIKHIGGTGEANGGYPAEGLEALTGVTARGAVDGDDRADSPGRQLSNQTDPYNGGDEGDLNDFGGRVINDEIDFLSSELAKGSAVMVGTGNTTAYMASLNLVGPHCYEVTGMRQEPGTGRWIIQLKNPYGPQPKQAPGYNPPVPGLNPGELYADDALNAGLTCTYTDFQEWSTDDPVEPGSGE